MHRKITLGSSDEQTNVIHNRFTPITAAHVMPNITMAQDIVIEIL